MKNLRQPKTEYIEDPTLLTAKIRELERKVSEGEAVRESLAISEAKYKTIIDNLVDIVFTNSIDGTVAYATRSVEQYGYTVEEIIGRNILEFVHPDDRQLAADVHMRLIASGGEISLIINMLTKSGQTRLMEDHAKTVLNSEGKVIHIVGILRDITEKKAAEEALESMNIELEERVRKRTVELSRTLEDLKTEMHERMLAQKAKVQSERILSDVINFLPDPTFVVDANSKVIVWNHAMEALTGIKSSSILGKGNHEYAMALYKNRKTTLIDFAIEPTKLQNLKDERILRKGDTFTADIFIPNLRNKPTYLWGIAKPFYDPQGKILGAIESLRDVTPFRDIGVKLSNELSKFRALYDLAVNMSTEKSLDENLVFIVEKSRELLDADAAFIALVDEAREELYGHAFSGNWTDAFKSLSLPLGEGPARLIMKSRNGCIIDCEEAYKASHRVYDWIILSEGLTSLIAAPVQAGEKKLGILCVANRKATKFAQPDLDTLLLFGRFGAIEILQKRAESDLRESETKYRTVFETTGSAMAIIERDGTLSLVNEEFARLVGYAKEAIEGKMKWTHFVEPDDMDYMEKRYRKHRESLANAPRRYEVRFLDRHGTSKDVFMIVDRIPGTKDRVAAMLDITKRKRAEKDLKKAHMELERRVIERTRELTVANTDLRELLRKQNVNIDLAKNILAMINAQPSRHTFIENDCDLFFTACYLPCYAEGGDHYLFKNISERHPGIHKTIISLKDQSGHEVSCILRSIITDLIHNALIVNTLDLPIEKTMNRLNKEICGLPFFGEENFFTSINTEIHHENLKMRYVSTGHPPFLLIRHQDVYCCPSVDGKGRHMPIGVLETVDYTSGEIQLQKGDKLIFFTDGLTDIPHMSGRPVLNADDIMNIVVSILREKPDVPVSVLMIQLFDRLRRKDEDRIAASNGFEDDITMLGLELEDSVYVHEDIVRPRNLDDFSQRVTELYQNIRQEWTINGFSSPETRLRIVLEEAMANAWRHGNRENPEKSILVRRRYGNDAVLEVIDEGHGFAFETFYDPTSQANLLNEKGRGNFIIRLLTDETQWKDGGRHLIACFARNAKSSQTPKPGLSFDLWRRLKKEKGPANRQRS